jgi:hypothetical protein
MGHGQSEGGLGWRSLEQGDLADSAPLGCKPSQEQTGLNCGAKLILTMQLTARAASFGEGNGWEVPRVTRIA